MYESSLLIKKSEQYYIFMKKYLFTNIFGQKHALIKINNHYNIIIFLKYIFFIKIYYFLNYVVFSCYNLSCTCEAKFYRQGNSLSGLY